MSAYNMKPTFRTQTEYSAWLRNWSELYREVTQRIQKLKLEVKTLQRSDHTSAAEAQKRLRQERAMGAKAMTLLEEAKIRWQNITSMHEGIAEQFASFPLVLEDCRNIDFHFNKKHLEFPDIVPMWIIKAKGKSYYVSHVDCETAWTTREQPNNPSTKGAIRIKRGNIHIDAEGAARIY